LYGIGQDADKTAYDRSREVVTDTRNAAADALQEKKFNEDVRQFGLRYALDQAQESRLGRESSNPKLTKQDYVQQYVAAFSPGNVMGDGTPTVDPNGYITPKAFKEAATEAAGYGISRKEFIELFGSQLFTDKKGNVDPQYGLTAVEKKLIGVPE